VVVLNYSFIIAAPRYSC